MLTLQNIGNGFRFKWITLYWKFRQFYFQISSFNNKYITNAIIFSTVVKCHLLDSNYWLGLWCLTPLSTIFQLYRGGQCYWWRKLEYPEIQTNDWTSVSWRIKIKITTLGSLQQHSFFHPTIGEGLHSTRMWMSGWHHEE